VLDDVVVDPEAADAIGPQHERQRPSLGRARRAVGAEALELLGCRQLAGRPQLERGEVAGAHGLADVGELHRVQRAVERDLREDADHDLIGRLVGLAGELPRELRLRARLEVDDIHLSPDDKSGAQSARIALL
jgi:hypothetical protein